MRKDYINVDVNKQKAGAFSGLGSALSSVLTGLADWIGLGNPIRSLYEEESDNYKALKKAKTMLTNRINELLAKRSIDIQRLEDKLRQLENAGFALSGIALKAYSKEVDQARNKYKEKQSEYEHDKLNLAKAQNDVDSLNADAIDIDDVQKQLGATSEIENQLNRIYKGGES